MFNTGDDGGGNLLEATVLRQVWTQRGVLGGWGGGGGAEERLDRSLSAFTTYMWVFL